MSDEVKDGPAKWLADAVNAEPAPFAKSGVHDPPALLAEIAESCRAVANAYDRGRVDALALAVLRDKVNDLRRHVSIYGYATVPGLVGKSGER